MNRRTITSFICEEDYPVVRTEKGKLRGYVDGDVFCFRGIGYAKARRFHMPEPVEEWDGIKDALDYGCGCPEMTFSIKGKKPEFDLLMPQKLWHFSEDCLNLNVWTKSIEPGVKKPVMVWLHGGGFFGGSATQLYSYEGWEMSHNYDVVLVTVNHRLNMLGFMDLSEYGEEYRCSANAGIVDLLAALTWVKKNIEAFGGDPDNVTIYGQSGGGMKVSTLMQMPAADGLYHKAIIQSGIMRGIKTAEHGKEITARVLELLGIRAESVHEIETADYETVAAVVKTAFAEFGMDGMRDWMPKADPGFFEGHPLLAGFRKENCHIPVMIGSCLGEFDVTPIGRKSNWTDEQRMQVLRERYGKDAERVKELFCAAYPEMDWSYAAGLDACCRPAIGDFLRLRRKQSTAPVYSYIFTFESPLMGGRLPMHSGELHFMFHNAAYMEGVYKPGITGRLQDEMAGAWAQFAKTGNPNGENLPEWPAWEEAEGCCMAYGDVTVLKRNHDEELIKIAEKYSAR